MDLLIIDDDKFMKKVFSEIFANRDIDFEIVEDPHIGLDIISDKRPKCAMIDYNMPRLNGDDLIVLSSQKLQFQHTDFVMVTAENFSEMDKMKLMTLGFQYIFKKSEISNGLLVETVKSIIDEKSKKAA